jgi:tripartite ATP-independent transporter DctM subunit
MDTLTIGLLGVVGVVTLVVVGVRAAYAAALVGFLGLVALRGWPPAIGVAGLIPHSQSSYYGLSVLPMFILIGYLAFYAGLTTGAFRAARAWFGWAPGGLATATVFATAGFAAVSGASTATAAVFSRIAIPEMLKYGYDRRLAAGVVAAGGTLASLIPPSAILVIYGIIVEQSIGRLLLAGFIPGIVSALIYAAVITIWALWKPKIATPVRGISWGERVHSLRGVWGLLAVITVILGGIYLGWMTPTEAGACGAFIVFVMALAQRQMSWKDFKDALFETAKLSVMIFTIIWCVMIFVRFLGFTGLPGAFATWIAGLPVDPIVVLLLLLAAYVVLGMFMDAIGMLLLTLPVVFPAILALGFDPIWFGIILVKMVEICLITPPIGLNCFVVSGVRPDIPLEDIFRGVAPFFIADLITVGVLIAYPELVLFLPNTMLGT